MAQSQCKKLSVLTVAVVCLILAMPTTSNSQQPGEVIAKEGLLRSLGRKVLSSKTLVDEVRQRGVAFQLNSEDEHEIRRAGKYLGRKGLNDLIAAIRDGYRTKILSPSPLPAISQTMTNSPGGVQAGGNVTINQGPPQRRLTEAQQAIFIKILAENPKGMIAVTCVENSGPEACIFARQLVSLLESKAAGWTVNFTPMLAWGDPKKTIPELYILVQDNKNPPIRAAVLQTALKAVGHNAIGIEKSDLPSPDFVQLTVSTKQPELEVPRDQPDQPVEKITTAVEVISSRRDDFPFGLRLTIQTNVVISPVHFLIECTEPIGDASGGPVGGGGLTMVRESYSADRRQFEFSYQSPPFTPQSPLAVHLFSATRIRVLRVVRLN